jgi:hypothetical protein
VESGPSPIRDTRADRYATSGPRSAINALVELGWTKSKRQQLWSSVVGDSDRIYSCSG